MTKDALARRELLKYTAAAGLIGALDPLHVRRAFGAVGAEKITFAAWTAAVDQVKAHITAFEKETGITVEYVNAPWAQYRETMIPKLGLAISLGALYAMRKATGSPQPNDAVGSPSRFSSSSSARTGVSRGSWRG